MQKVLLLLLILFSSGADAQSTGKTDEASNSISGIVLDSTTKQAIEYATITLVNTATKKTVSGTITDKKGAFSLQKIAEGNLYNRNRFYRLYSIF